MPAVMAHEPLVCAVIGHVRAAIGTLVRITAFSAGNQFTGAAAVEKQNALLSPVQIRL